MNNPTDSVTESELEEFRAQWRQQLVKPQPGPADSDPAPTPAPAPAKIISLRPNKHNAPPATAAAAVRARSRSRARSPAAHNSAAATVPEVVPAIPAHASLQSRGRSPAAPTIKETMVVPSGSDEATMAALTKATKAMSLYESGLDHEQAGQLSDALRFYRAAFKLDADVDIRHRDNVRAHMATADAAAAAAAAEAAKFVSETTTVSLAAGSANNSDDVVAFPDGFLAWVTAMRHMHLPLLPYSPDLHPHVPISVLPDDLILQVLSSAIAADPAAFSALSRVCQKFAVLAREPTVWRQVCVDHYVHRRQEISRVPRDDWIMFFRSEPRVRFEGAYVCACRYIRPGFSDSSWSAPTQLIEYFRYLRFFRNGTALAHMTPTPPRSAVKNLHLAAAQTHEGYQYGTYMLEGDILHIEMKDKHRPGTDFRIRLLVQGSRRRTNRGVKLQWVSYSVTMLMGMPGHKVPEETEMDVREFRDYSFAKVKSYVH
ncbi:hypothetical protein BC828DRAFT_404221 [Blastocladiella britannica]|nr:hypothetical protein BC828DRAFT_404221 [Blastocladiella britannica]